MSDFFTNFLGGVVSGVFDSADLKDYQHADRLYVRENYARAPKIGFLYFVSFNFNTSNANGPSASTANAAKVGFLDQLGNAVKSTVKNIKDSFLSGIKKGIGAGPTSSLAAFSNEAGFLVRAVDLPKFTIVTETINQYNRKTVVQTGMKYNPVSFTFHDDNSNITNFLWNAYFKHYYSDRNLPTGGGARPVHPVSFEDTKFGTTNYTYGLNQPHAKDNPAIKSIDIYVLHQGNFTQYTLINPKITEWAHDTLNQDESNKILTNKMTVAYETVYFSTGRITKNGAVGGFTKYYDKTPSPLSIGGNGTNTLFGEGGIINGASSVFGSISGAIESGNPLDFLGAAIQAKNVAQNVRQLSKAGLKQEGYSILGGVLGNVAAAGREGAQAAIGRDVSSRAGVLGNVSINFSKLLNTSVNGTTKATPGSGGGG